MDEFERACVFIDGENLRHSLIDLLQPQFNERDYLPKSANWGTFFDNLVLSARAKIRVRTYWYVVGNLDFWPWKLPPNDDEKLVKIVSKDSRYGSELAKLAGDAKAKKAHEIRTRLLAQRERIRQRFDGWTAIQDGISMKADATEFRRTGSICYDLFRDQFRSEKGVDVNLAVDLLKLRSNFDLAIIVSGDQDYMAAVQAVKDSGKRVINTCFLKRDGQLLPGGARRLNQMTDRVLNLDYEAVRNYMGFAPAVASTS